MGFGPKFQPLQQAHASQIAHTTYVETNHDYQQHLMELFSMSVSYTCVELDSTKERLEENCISLIQPESDMYRIFKAK